MLNTSVRAAAAGMPSINRRYFLRSTAAVATASATVAMPVVAVAASANSPSHVAENPRLLELSGQMSDAQAALAAAQDKVDWIVAEWRHLWPLAPPELLWLGDAHRQYYREGTVIERDLAGNFLMRDASDCALIQKPADKTCFTLETVKDADHHLARLAANPPTGRTPKSLVRNSERHAESVRKWTAIREAANKYEAEAARIRELSGIEPVKAKVLAADKRIQWLLGAIMQEPAHTMDGLRIKLRLIQQHVLSGPNAKLYAQLRGIPMGWIGPFAEDVAGVIGEAV